MVDASTPIVPPVVDITPAQPLFDSDLSCVITTPASGGDFAITYSAAWMRNGAPYTGSPGTVMFANDMIVGADVAKADVYQCTVTATDGHQSVMATSSAAAAICVTGGMMQFAVNGAPPTGTLQTFTVPTGVCSLTIAAGGGQGGDGTATNGALLIGTFDVTPADVLTILVGPHAGTTGANRLAGGGGTFVLSAGSPLVIAGGGGSSFDGSIATTESVGRIVTSGGTAGATVRADNGDGGNVVAGGASGGGGGFLTSGGGTGGGAGYGVGAAGGGSLCSGGYGGGGGRTNSFGEGGGGGYSGGSCADTVSTWVGCGGGGSINNGSNQTNTAGTVVGDGYVTITW